MKSFTHLLLLSLLALTARSAWYEGYYDDDEEDQEEGSAYDDYSGLDLEGIIQLDRLPDPRSIIVPVHYPQNRSSSPAPKDTIIPLWNGTGGPVDIPDCKNHRITYTQLGPHRVDAGSHIIHLPHTEKHNLPIIVNNWPDNWWVLVEVECLDLQTQHKPTPWDPSHTYSFAIRPNFDGLQWFRNQETRELYTYQYFDHEMDAAWWGLEQFFVIPLFNNSGLYDRPMPDYPVPIDYHGWMGMQFSPCYRSSVTSWGYNNSYGRYFYHQLTPSETDLIFPDVTMASYALYTLRCVPSPRARTTVPYGIVVRPYFRDFDSGASSPWYRGNYSPIPNLIIHRMILGYWWTERHHNVTIIKPEQNFPLVFDIPSGLIEYNFTLAQSPSGQLINLKNRSDMMLPTYNGTHLTLTLLNMTKQNFGLYHLNISYYRGHERVQHNTIAHFTPDIPDAQYFKALQALKNNYGPNTREEPPVVALKYQGDMPQPAPGLTQPEGDDERFTNKTLAIVIVVGAALYVLTILGFGLCRSGRRRRGPAHIIYSPVYEPTTLPDVTMQ